MDEVVDVLSVAVEVAPLIFEMSQEFLLARPGIFDEEVDFRVDSNSRNLPIWDVGQRKSDGKIFASAHPAGIFYSNAEEYDCLWLR